MLDPVELARLCAEAYAVPPYLEVGDVHLIKRPHAVGWVYVFRGSADCADWACDLEAIPWPHPDLQATVHEGFGRDVDAVWPALAADLGAVPVGLAGHSKGGADAILVGLRMALAGIAPAFIVTFGAPRVFLGGHPVCLDRVLQAHYRHGCDLVPTLPPGDWWRHPADLIAVGQPGDPIRDHFIAGYLAALSAPAKTGVPQPAGRWLFPEEASS